MLVFVVVVNQQIILLLSLSGCRWFLYKPFVKHERSQHLHATEVSARGGTATPGLHRGVSGRGQGRHQQHRCSVSVRAWAPGTHIANEVSFSEKVATEEWLPENPDPSGGAAGCLAMAWSFWGQEMHMGSDLSVFSVGERVQSLRKAKGARPS